MQGTVLVNGARALATSSYIDSTCDPAAPGTQLYDALQTLGPNDFSEVTMG